jgi:hypothetical protein
MTSFLALLLAVQYGHHGRYLLPSHAATPGEVRTTSMEAVCSEHTRQFRHTTYAMKLEVCREYGQENCPGKAYEIDHLVSLEIGGADTVRNLWPQPIDQARVKDKLETHLRVLICSGQMTVAAAQHCIVDDWVECMSKVEKLEGRL